MSEETPKVMNAAEYTAAVNAGRDMASSVSVAAQQASKLMSREEMEAARDRHLAAFGVTHKTIETPALDGDGNPVMDEEGNPVMNRQLVITSVPDETIKLMSFFSEAPDFECWFGGCEGLRKQYLADLEEAGGASCPDCKRGAIIRKYMPIVRDAIRNSKDEKLTNVVSAGSVGVSGPAEGSGSGAAKNESLLRRAASYLKKVFKPS